MEQMDPWSDEAIAQAAAEVRRMTDTAAAVTDSLGLPPEKKYVVLQALYGDDALENERTAAPAAQNGSLGSQVGRWYRRILDMLVTPPPVHGWPRTAKPLIAGFAVAVLMLIGAATFIGLLRNQGNADLAKQVGQPFPEARCTFGCGGGNGGLLSQLFRANLAGPTNAPGGMAQFSYSTLDRKLVKDSLELDVEVSVDDATLPPGPLSVSVDARSYGITHSNEGKQVLYLDAAHGDVVPHVHQGSVIQLQSGSAVVLTGTFACALPSCIPI